MENLNNHFEEVAPVTTENHTINQSGALITRKVEKVKSFRDYAYEQAGLNRGESFSLTQVAANHSGLPLLMVCW